MESFESGVTWCTETQTLSGWIEVNGERKLVCIPREMIHARLSVYNDALEWEIERFKDDILDRLKPHLLQEAAE